LCGNTFNRRACRTMNWRLAGTPRARIPRSTHVGIGDIQRRDGEHAKNGRAAEGPSRGIPHFPDLLPFLRTELSSCTTRSTAVSAGAGNRGASLAGLTTFTIIKEIRKSASSRSIANTPSGAAWRPALEFSSLPSRPSLGIFAASLARARARRSSDAPRHSGSHDRTPVGATESGPPGTIRQGAYPRRVRALLLGRPPRPSYGERDGSVSPVEEGEICVAQR
jgi:hypothetical protein